MPNGEREPLRGVSLVLPAWALLPGLGFLAEPWGRILALALTFLLVLLLAWAYMVPMPGSPFQGPAPTLSGEEEALRDRLEGHVRMLADEIGERNFVEKEALDEAARYVERSFREMGYAVEIQEYALGDLTFRNVEATLPGADRADEVVVVGAHYDSAEGTPGANDNASGVAALLELARSFRHRNGSRTIRFVAFTNEEPPFFQTDRMGSRVYAARAMDEGWRVTAMLSLETIGYFDEEPGSQRYPAPFGHFYPDRGDFIGFVGNLGSRRLVRRSVAAFRGRATVPSYGLAAPSWIPGVGWSDHSSFWRHGYPAVMITDTAPFRYPYYHHPGDTPDRLDFDTMTRVVTGVEAVVRELAGDG
jgi:hypothetical protein